MSDQLLYQDTPEAVEFAKQHIRKVLRLNGAVSLATHKRAVELAVRQMTLDREIRCLGGSFYELINILERLALEAQDDA